MSTFETISVIFCLWSKMRSPEVKKGQIFANLPESGHAAKHRPLAQELWQLETIRKKGSIPLETLFLQCAIRFDLRSIVQAPEVIKGQLRHFAETCLSLTILLLAKISKWKYHHRVSLVKPVRMMYGMTSKGQFENLTSGQGHDLTEIGHVAYH